MSPLWLLLLMIVNVLMGIWFDNDSDQIIPVIFFTLEAVVSIIWVIYLLALGVTHYGT